MNTAFFLSAALLGGGLYWLGRPASQQVKPGQAVRVMMPGDVVALFPAEQRAAIVGSYPIIRMRVTTTIAERPLEFQAYVDDPQLPTAPKNPVWINRGRIVGFA